MALRSAGLPLKPCTVTANGASNQNKPQEDHQTRFCLPRNELRAQIC